MSQEWKAPAGEEDDVQMPLGVGGDAAPAEEYSAPSRVRVNTSTVALMAAFAAALIVLYFLGLQNKPRAASADELNKAQTTDSKIQEWIKNRKGQEKVNGMFTESERLIKILALNFDNRSAAVEVDPRVNPFGFLPDKEVVATGPSGDPIVIKQQTLDPVDPQLLEAAKMFATLKLQMIMVGAPSSALINNQMASVGTKFGPLTVTEIQTDRVILGYKEKAFELKSSNPQMGGH